MILLEACPVFKNLNEQEFSRVCSVTREFTLAAGEKIFKEGDPGNGMYILKSGLVQISVVFNQSDQIVLTRLKPGDLPLATNGIADAREIRLPRRARPAYHY